MITNHIIMPPTYSHKIHTKVPDPQIAMFLSKLGYFDVVLDASNPFNNTSDLSVPKSEAKVTYPLIDMQ